MAKELPYFQFEPAEYLTKDVSFCSLSAQGMFINICSYYWQRQCSLTKEQLLRRLDYPDILDELINEGVIDLEGNNIIIKFLDLQYKNATNKSNINTINGLKGGRPKKKTESKPNQNPNHNRNETESKGIREDKIIKDNIKEEKKREIAPAIIKDSEDFELHTLEDVEYYFNHFGSNPDQAQKFYLHYMGQRS